MFGYVRPYKSELKVGEYELFKAAYCGLCSALKTRYGLAGRFILTYDFVFLAMLLSAPEKGCSFDYQRCIASPLRRKRCCVTTDRFLRSADCSMILFWWKLKDSAADGSVWEKCRAYLAMAALHRPYRKARRYAPEFDGSAKSALTGLSALERAGCDSLDRVADKFASLLTAAAGQAGDPASVRALEQLLYHTGRAIYIMDAVDDLSDDLKRGRYNAAACRFGIRDGVLGEEDRAWLQTTLGHSFALVSAAFELLPAGMWSPILSNIVYLGLPWVGTLVMGGKWKGYGKSIHNDIREYKA